MPIPPATLAGILKSAATHHKLTIEQAVPTIQIVTAEKQTTFPPIHAMPRKLTKKQLMRRQIENGLGFVAARHKAMHDEEAWARGIKPLPKSRPIPPEWVRKAIIRTTETTLSPIYRLAPSKGGDDLFGNLMELNGMALAGGSFFANLPDSIKAAAAASPEVRGFIKGIEKDVVQRIAPALKKGEKANALLLKNLTPANPQQLQENLARLQKGSTALIDADGQFTKGRTKIAMLYLLLWVFWPQLKAMDNAREMKAALDTFTDENLSQKLVEKVCTELGVFKGKRGRPRARKFLPAAKRA